MTYNKSINMIDVKLKIFESDGYICASGVGIGIYTYAKTWNKLMKNIHEAVEAIMIHPLIQRRGLFWISSPR